MWIFKICCTHIEIQNSKALRTLLKSSTDITASTSTTLDLLTPRYKDESLLFIIGNVDTYSFCFCVYHTHGINCYATYKYKDDIAPINISISWNFPKGATKVSVSTNKECKITKIFEFAY